METLTTTLVERVQAFVQPDRSPVEWGSPLLSTTPTPLAIHQLAVQLAAAEQAIVEIAQDVSAIVLQVQSLAARLAAAGLDG